MKKLKRYKLQAGVQKIEMDTPDYSSAYNFQTEQNAKNKGISQVAQQFSGAYAPIGQVGGMAADVIRNRSKNKKTGSTVGGAVEMGTSGAALGAQLGGPWGAAAGLVVGSTYGTIKGAKDYEKTKVLAQEQEKKTALANANKQYIEGAATDAQAALAKKGKYKVKTKQPRMIETEGREPIFSPKKADGTRDLLYYNPNDPTHEEGGVKAVVMPKNRYSNGANNLMPRRSKTSLVGSGIMAVGAKQIKVNDLNNTAFSNNLANTPSANAANAFIQPQAGINQVARQIPQERRQEKIRTERSHKKVNPDTNRIIDPPMLYEMKPPPPRSTFNTKNDFKKGGGYVKAKANAGMKKGGKNIKTYQIGTQGTEADATYKHTRTFNSKPAYQAALQAHDDSLNLYSQSRYFTDKVKESGLYNSTVENPEVRNITRTGTGKTHSPLKAYGAPNDSSEDVMTIAGINPMRKDLYSRKENKYKSFKEYDEAKATGNPEKHEGYEINMYKHPEMALNFKADTAETIQPRKSKLKTSSDSTVNKTPVKTIITPTKETVVDITGTKTTPVANKPVTTRGKFVGREKTLLDKAGEFLNKVGSSKRMSNGKSVRVFK